MYPGFNARYSDMPMGPTRQEKPSFSSQISGFYAQFLAFFTIWKFDFPDRFWNRAPTPRIGQVSSPLESFPPPVTSFIRKCSLYHGVGPSFEGAFPIPISLKEASLPWELSTSSNFLNSVHATKPKEVKKGRCAMGMQREAHTHYYVL